MRRSEATQTACPPEPQRKSWLAGTLFLSRSGVVATYVISMWD